MKKTKKSSAWTAGPAPRGSSGMEPISHSGGENQQLDPTSYDGRDRVIASATGGTVTATQLTREGKNVPADSGWRETPVDHYEVNSGPNFRSGPGIPRLKRWLKK